MGPKQEEEVSPFLKKSKSSCCGGGDSDQDHETKEGKVNIYYQHFLT